MAKFGKLIFLRTRRGNYHLGNWIIEPIEGDDRWIAYNPKNPVKYYCRYLRDAKNFVLCQFFKIEMVISRGELRHGRKQIIRRN